MIRLKTLLTEFQYTYTNPKTPITMGPTDPWEYYMDVNTNKWYTRKKGTDEWIDMEAKLPNANMQKALDKLNVFTHTTPGVEKVKPKKGDKVKFNTIAAKVGENLTVYKYNNTGFYKVGTYRVEQNPNVIYLGQDSSAEYALVKFPEGKYWIKKRFLL